MLSRIHYAGYIRKFRSFALRYVSKRLRSLADADSVYICVILFYAAYRRLDLREDDLRVGISAGIVFPIMLITAVLLLRKKYRGK